MTRTTLNQPGAVAAVIAAWLLVVLGHNRTAKDHQQVRRPLERV